MSHYMIRARQSPETWARFLRNPEDRSRTAQSGTGDIGCEIVGYWYALGSYDVYSVAIAPDDETAMAIRAALFSSGTFTQYDMFTLLTLEEMKTAAASIDRWPHVKNYRAPGVSE